MNGALRYLKEFTEWLSQKAGYKLRIKYSDVQLWGEQEQGLRYFHVELQRRFSCD
jgi:hypothetical protein